MMKTSAFIATILLPSMLLLGCSEQEKLPAAGSHARSPLGHPVTLNETLQDGTIAVRFTTVQVSPQTSMLGAPTRIGQESKPLTTFLIRYEIENIGVIDVQFSGVQFQGLLKNEGVTSYTIAVEPDKPLIKLKPGEKHTGEERVDSTSENEILFNLLIKEQDGTMHGWSNLVLKK
jgi:hypothetical protein